MNTINRATHREENGRVSINQGWTQSGVMNHLAAYEDTRLEPADIEELLAAVPRWISVEERLPEENKNYLTYGVFLPLGVKAMDMYRFDGTKWLTSADVEITHWMPLPAPPTEVD